MTYPKWVQRAPDIGAVLCLDEAEEKQLLDDWAARDKPQEDGDAKEPTKDGLIAEAKALGIDAKGTWGVAKLKAEIAAAKLPE